MQKVFDENLLLIFHVLRFTRYDFFFMQLVYQLYFLIHIRN